MPDLVSNLLQDRKTEAFNLTLELLKGLRTGKLAVLVHTKFIPLVSKLCIDVSYQQKAASNEKAENFANLELARQDLVDRLENAGFNKKQASLPDDQNTWTKTNDGYHIDITIDPVRFSESQPFIRIIPNASPAA